MQVKVEKIAQLTGHNASIYALEQGETASKLLSGAGDGWIVEWNLDDPDLGRVIAQVETQIFSLLHLPAHQLVVAGNMNGGVHWVDLEDSTKGKNIAHHKKGVFGIVAVGNMVYTIGGQGLLSKWDLATKKVVESLHLSNQSLRCIAYSPIRNELAIGASDNGIYLLDANHLTIKQQLPNAHENSVFCLHYHPSQAFLLSGARDAHLKIWDLENQCKNIFAEPAHWFTINAIAFHPNGRLFATASRDKTLKIWDAMTFKLLKVLEPGRDAGHINSVNRLLWTSHHDYLISASDDRSMIIWKITEA